MRSSILIFWYSALRKLKAAVELNPEDVKMLILKASVHRSLQEYGAALSDLEEAARVFHRQREAVLQQAANEALEMNHHMGKYLKATQYSSCNYRWKNF